MRQQKLTPGIPKKERINPLPGIRIPKILRLPEEAGQRIVDAISRLGVKSLVSKPKLCSFSLGSKPLFLRLNQL